MKRCCGTSVGVLIQNAADQTLMITRGWWPKGTAPVAGHVADEHGTPAEAVAAEAAEEVGLTVHASTLLWQGHLPNLCASLPHESAPGHYWWLYKASIWEGTVTPAAGETQGAAWYSPDAVEAMAARTLEHYRTGGTAADQPDDSLEAVWIRLLFEAEMMLCVDDHALALAENAYTTPPAEHWLGGRR